MYSRDARILTVACALVRLRSNAYPCLLTFQTFQLTHLLYKKYEPTGFLINFGLLALQPYLLGLFTVPISTSAWHAFSETYILFYLALACSICIYRVSPFHPLAKYPGPFFAKVSKLWELSRIWSGRRHVLLQQLHEKYGPFVRIGARFIAVD